MTVKLEWSVPASAKIKICVSAKSPNRENNVSTEICCFTVYPLIHTKNAPRKITGWPFTNNRDFTVKSQNNVIKMSKIYNS